MSDSDLRAAAIRDMRDKLGCVDAGDCDPLESTDNVAIALASYFSRHLRRPGDDPDDPDSGWGEWVLQQTYATLDAMATTVLRAAIDKAMGGDDGKQ